MVKQFRMDRLVCPACDALLNGASAVNGDEAPTDGSPTICVYCRAVLIMVGDPPTSLRRPTLEEETKLLFSPGFQQAMRAVESLQRSGKLRGGKRRPR